ncbi:hypothetical protein ACFX2F_035147 [Malus domestica]
MIVRERGEEVTTEVCNRIYAEVLRSEKRNQVQGFGLGVGWANVPGIVTQQRGISKEVKYLREAYEAQKQATAAAEEKMTHMMHEANEKAEKMKRKQKESIQRLKAKQEENLRLAKVQMVKQLKAIKGVEAHMLIFQRVSKVKMTRMCSVSSAMMHEDCQSENTG